MESKRTDQADVLSTQTLLPWTLARALAPEDKELSLHTSLGTLVIVSLRGVLHTSSMQHEDACSHV